MTLTQQLAQFIASGIVNGTIYALLGLGLVAIHSVTRVVNVAQGEFAALGALLASTLVARGMPLSLAAGVAVVAAGVRSEPDRGAADGHPGGTDEHPGVGDRRSARRPRRCPHHAVDAGHVRHGVDPGLERVCRCRHGRHVELPLDGGGVYPVRCRRIARRGADLVELPRWNRVRGPGGRAPVARALGAAGRVDRQRGNRTRMIPTRRARLAATIAVVVLAILPYAVAGRISLSIFVFIGLFSLIVIGLSLLAGHAGQVSLGQAAFYGLGAYIAALCS